MARWLCVTVCVLAAVAVARAQLRPQPLVKSPFTVPCQFTPTGGVALGHTFDLTELQGQIFSASDINYEYKMSVCGVLPERSCQLSGGGLCQYTSRNGIYVHSLMSWTSAQQPIWNLIDPKNKNSGLTLQFTNGDTCFNMGQRVSRVVNLNFPCNSGSGVGNAYTVANTAQSPCVYTVNFPTATTCFDYVPSSAGKLSGLAILLILLLVVVPVYVAGGCLYKRQKLGVSGWDACPNSAFWQQFPAYVKDGGRSAYHKIRNCGKDTSDGDI